VYTEFASGVHGIAFGADREACRPVYTGLRLAQIAGRAVRWIRDCV
jgi:hypothetical protein